jgi:release factor glutamine methyltransferase
MVKIARRFNAGLPAGSSRVPKGRLKINSTNGSAVPSGLLQSQTREPGVKTPGYCRTVPSERIKTSHARHFALWKCRARTYCQAVTVLRAIQRSVDFLAKKGVESPRLQAELLLAHVLQVPRMKLYLDFERILTDDQQATLREFVRRRGQREPLQHILGTTSFCGLDLEVTGDVLVPRPETELLAERGWEFLKKRMRIESANEPLSPALSPPGGAREKKGALPDAQCGAKNVAERGAIPPTALDFGTGSGCIAIAIAVQQPNVQIVALDISTAALALARRNAVRNAVDSRIEFLASDGFAALPDGAKFDLIISNPPYIPTAEIATLDPEVRDHDPRRALDGGADGLDFYRRLAREAAAFLRTGGRLMVELGHGQEAAARKIFSDEKWVVEFVEPDYHRVPRILAARRED